MINWNELIKEQNKENDILIEIPKNNWISEISYSLCELYYRKYRTKRGCGQSQRIDLRSGSDFNRFLESHMKPLEKYGVWEALFPNKISATSAVAIDEALHLLADSKLVDRVYSGDIVTVNKIVNNIEKKRAKYLDLL